MDDLAATLADLGQRITTRGCAAEPRIQPLAQAMRSIAPVASDVLACDDEPDIVRCRAFLHVTSATARLTSVERRALALRLAEPVMRANVA